MAESNASKFSSKITSDGTIGQGGLAAGVGDTDWQAVKTTSFTAVAGEGYFVDTTSGAITVTLPSSPSIGDTVSISDVSNSFNTNNVTVGRNGSKINGTESNATLNEIDTQKIYVYSGTTYGWIDVNSDAAPTPLYISATGGTVTESGDYKIHTFTGDGCFVVSCAGNASGSTVVDYLVVAGGGSGGGGGCGAGGGGGGGGAGGYREAKTGCAGCYTASPLATPTGITVSATTYPVTVGGGGSSVTTTDTNGNPGSNSVFSTITSAGGGGGGGGRASASSCTYRSGLSGGSGGGAGGGSCTASPSLAPGGSGNTPPVSPPQGNNGGSVGPGAVANRNAASGGGATAVGSSYDCGAAVIPGPGGAGATSSITGSPVARAGGGGGGAGAGPDSAPPVDGGGKGGYANCNAATAGTANTGGGGGGGGDNVSPTLDGAAGGSGIVIIRYKFQ